MVEEIRIEADEHGFELVLVGDLTEACEAYLAGEGLSLRVNVHAAVFAFAGSRGLAELLEWWAEGEAVRREVSRARDDGDGYAMDDPKHPTYYERMVEHADRD